jgi:hypothetical protein
MKASTSASKAPTSNPERRAPDDEPVAGLRVAVPYGHILAGSDTRPPARKPASRSAAIGVFACLFVLIVILGAPKAQAQNFRIADQVYLLAAAHAVSPWTTYASDAWIANETADPVSVSVVFFPYGAHPISIERRDVVKLAPHERREICDFVGPVRTPPMNSQCKYIGLMGITSGFGYVIFNGCLDGADCAGPWATAHANYRDISVESRSYSFATVAVSVDAGPSVGQDIPGLPYWTHADTNDPVRITGIRASDRFKTKLVFVNPSPYSEMWLTVRLFDGASVGQRDSVNLHFGPGDSLGPIDVLDLFPKFGEWSRFNRSRPASNASVDVIQSGVIPTADAVAAGCPDGCSGFVALGSLLDSITGDGTTLEATFGRALTNQQVSALFPAPPVIGENVLPLSAKLADLSRLTEGEIEAGVTKLAAEIADMNAHRAKALAPAPRHRRLEKE